MRISIGQLRSLLRETLTEAPIGDFEPSRSSLASRLPPSKVVRDFFKRIPETVDIFFPVAELPEAQITRMRWLELNAFGGGFYLATPDEATQFFPELAGKFSPGHISVVLHQQLLPSEGDNGFTITNPAWIAHDIGHGLGRQVGGSDADSELTRIYADMRRAIRDELNARGELTHQEAMKNTLGKILGVSNSRLKVIDIEDLFPDLMVNYTTYGEVRLVRTGVISDGTLEFFERQITEAFQRQLERLVAHVLILVGVD